MESTNLSKAKPFLYSWVTFQQNKVKGKKKKKRPTWLLFIEIEKVVQNSPWREAEWHMCGKAGCLCAWIQTGPGTGSRPEHKAKHYCHRAATQPTAPTQQFWEAFENIPLPLQHFPSGSLILRPQGRILHLCVLTEHFMLPAGHREPGRSQGGSCTASMGFLAKGRGNPRDRGAWWTRGRKEFWTRLGQWARAAGGSTTQTDPKHTWVPAKATRRRPEGRGQPVQLRAEDESLDRPTSTGHEWPALEKDLTKTPSRISLHFLSMVALVVQW